MVLWLFANGSVAADNSLSETRSQVKAMDKKIALLEKTLAKSHNKKDTLNQLLAQVEKQIGANIQKLKTLQHDIDASQATIDKQQQRINALNQDLTTQQQTLTRHIQSRYKTHEYEPLKWLLNQNDPHAINRLLTYYHYLIKARTKVIDNVLQIQKELHTTQEALKAELEKKNQLKQSISNEQSKLTQDKKYHAVIIGKLDADIQSTEQALREFKKNRQSLLHLLKQLNASSARQVTKAFKHLRHHLPRPVTTSGNSLQAMNQGVTFFAGEGTPVRAVYPGKIVFSDWLRGYGLLLIIDHGDGFMTLYAHNQSLAKDKGDIVGQGETIASVGHSGGLKQNGLYFEVRHKGKAVPPLDWLS